MAGERHGSGMLCVNRPYDRLSGREVDETVFFNGDQTQCTDDRAPWRQWTFPQQLSKEPDHFADIRHWVTLTGIMTSEDTHRLATTVPLNVVHSVTVKGSNIRPAAFIDCASVQILFYELLYMPFGKRYLARPWIRSKIQFCLRNGS